MIQEVSKKIQFNLESFLASQVTWGVLRVLLSIPIIYHGPTETARALGTSRASATRALRKLVAAGLSSRSRGRYRINTEQPITKYIWLLLQAERQRNLPADLLNKLELLLGSESGRVHAAVLFGSWARGLADEQSDVDLCVFGEDLASGRAIRQPYTFELHAFCADELTAPSNTVVLDALLNGIVVKNPERVYTPVVGIRSFPKAFLLSRLEQAQDFVARSEESEGVAQEYYLSLANRTLQQIQSILERGRTISRGEIETIEALEPLLHKLSVRIAQEADKIWLT